MKTRSKALGFGGGEAGYALDGARSAVRLRTTDNMQFAVKVGMMMSDPSMMIKLYHFDSGKNSREAILGGQGGPFGKGKKDSKTEVLYRVQKSGNDVYLLSPAAKLSPGEYGFMNMMMANTNGMTMSYTFFTFGVDE